MGLYAAFIEFGIQLPPAEKLREQLLDITGVEIAVEQDEAGYLISSDDIKNTCVVDVDESTAIVLLPRSTYLECACIAAFVRLGGRYDYPIPKIVEKTWYSYSYFRRILLKRGLW
jgi:hypothetical protein